MEPQISIKTVIYLKTFFVITVILSVINQIFRDKTFWYFLIQCENRWNRKITTPTQNTSVILKTNKSAATQKITSQTSNVIAKILLKTSLDSPNFRWNPISEELQFQFIWLTLFQNSYVTVWNWQNHTATTPTSYRT